MMPIIYGLVASLLILSILFVRSFLHTRDLNDKLIAARARNKLPEYEVDQLKIDLQLTKNRLSIYMGLVKEHGLPKLSQQTIQLIRLATQSNSSEEARTAALPACKQIIK